MNQIKSDLSTDAFSFRDFEKDPLRLLAEVSTSQMIWLGHSVKMDNPPHYNHLNRQTGQYTPGCSYPLIVYAPSHSQPTGSELVSFKPLNKENQQQVLTESSRFKAIQPIHYIPLTLEEQYLSRVDEASNAKHITAEKCGKFRKYQAKYNASEKGKEVRHNYNLSARCSEIKRIYNLSMRNKVLQKLRSAKSVAYRAAIRKGINENKARESGKLAAKNKKDYFLQHPPFGLSVEELKECLKLRRGSSHE